jgi:multidrug efflux pump subunit AcrA (membrane-fusion protein)
MGLRRITIAWWLVVAAKISATRSVTGLYRMTGLRWLGVAATIAAVAVGTFAEWQAGVFVGATILPDAVAQSQPTAHPAPSSGGAVTGPVLELAEKQLDLIKIGAVGEHVFPVQQQAVGSIDFNEDMAVQVFTPYQGKIISPIVDIGDDVAKGQPLFTIDSPDLVQAESTLIAAAGVLELTTKALARVRRLYATAGTGGIAEKDLNQAISDQQTGEGALRAARAAVRVYGKTDAEIDGIVARRQIGTGGQKPDRRQDHGAQCAAGASRAAGNRAGALFGCRYFDDVDGGEHPRDRHRADQARAGGEGLGHGASRPGV